MEASSYVTHRINETKPGNQPVKRENVATASTARQASEMPIDEVHAHAGMFFPAALVNRTSDRRPLTTSSRFE
jgi:hypothetical protein